MKVNHVKLVPSDRLPVEIAQTDSNPLACSGVPAGVVLTPLGTTDNRPGVLLDESPLGETRASSDRLLGFLQRLGLWLGVTNGVRPKTYGITS